MPQALGAFIVGALVKAGAFALGSIAATLLTAVITVGASFGFSQLVNAVFGSGRPKPSDGQHNVTHAIGSRRRHYGIVHTGGQVSFKDSRNGTLGQVITLGTGEESDIIEHRINDKIVTLDGSGTVVEASYHGAIHIHTRSGTDDQTAIGELTAKFPEWTSSHRQRGSAHAAIIADPVKQKHFSEVFKGQIPQYTQVRKAAKLYDPRKDSTAIIAYDGAGDPVLGSGAHRLDDPGTWEWSDNAALVTNDFAAHPDGYGLGYDNVNWTRAASEADQCDASVTTINSETIARWRIWASYSLASEERKQVLTDMIQACDGFVWQDADGKFNLLTGRFEEPDVVITDDHILGMTATLGPESRHRVSAVKVLYTEAAIGYREQESATIIDPAAPADPNTDPQAVSAFFAPHHNQAARIGKITLARLGDRWRITAQLNLFGLNLLGKRFCRLETDQLGVYAYFVVDKLTLNLADLQVQATLSEVRPEDWNFDAASEEGQPPEASGSSSSAPIFVAPSGITLAAVPIAFGETNGVALQVSWADYGRAGFEFEAQYRPSAGGDWVSMTVDSEARTARSGPVDSAIEYEVRVRSLTITRWASGWSTLATITPVSSASLSAPASLTATGASGEADISFRMPTNSSLAYVRLYSATSSDFGTASQVGADIIGALGQMIDITDTGLSAGTQYYWARAFNGSGGSSALAGPASATIS